MITNNTNSTLVKKKKAGEYSDSSTTSLIRHFPSVKKALRRDPVQHKSIMHPMKDNALLSAGIFVKVDSCYKRIMPEDIYLVEALSDYVHIYTKEKRYTIYATMISMEEKLSSAGFMRVHRSYIVRIDNISSFENKWLSVEDEQIPIGKKYKREVTSRLNVLS